MASKIEIVNESLVVVQQYNLVTYLDELLYIRINSISSFYKRKLGVNDSIWQIRIYINCETYIYIKYDLESDAESDLKKLISLIK